MRNKEGGMRRLGSWRPGEGVLRDGFVVGVEGGLKEGGGEELSVEVQE
jgi:hypothetical protein